MDNSRSTGRVVAVVLGAVLCSVVAATSTADVAQAAAAAGPALVRPAAATAVPTATVAPGDITPAKVALVLRTADEMSSTGTWAVYGRGTDGQVYRRTVDIRTSSPIGGWQVIPGRVASGPDALRMDSSTFLLAARSTTGSLVVRTVTLTSTGSGWTDLGGRLTSAPVLTRNEDGTVAVFGRGTDGAVWFRLLRSGTWGPWRSMGGVLTSAPDAVSSWSGLILVGGRGTDGRIWQREITLSGEPAGGWATTTMVSTSAPSSYRQRHQYLGTFLRGQRNDLYEVTLGTDASHGGVLTSAPDGAAVGLSGGAPFSIAAVARGTDNAMWLWDENGWHSIGGRLS